jgi:hypothetical protein
MSCGRCKRDTRADQFSSALVAWCTAEVGVGRVLFHVAARMTNQTEPIKQIEPRRGRGRYR